MTLLDLEQHFEKTFGAKPQVFRAPGRVNLIGEHTDYNDGFVMPAAIGFYTYIAAAPRSDSRLALRSENFAGEFEFDANSFPAKRVGDWCDYLLGVAVTLVEMGHPIAGADLLVWGDMPVGAGLSSSAAIEVASALALVSLNGIRISTREIAQLCQKAENAFVGARVGIMDPFISCMGKAGCALFLDCRTLDYKDVPIPSDFRLVICNTMVKHELAAGQYNVRRQECEQGVRILARSDPQIRSLRDVSIEQLQRHKGALTETIRKRCLHVVSENQRVLDAARCLQDGDAPGLGTLMRASHSSLRDLYEVSCRELDIMVECAEDLPGYCGGRMTGGGFGGCTINLVQGEEAENFSRQIAARYKSATGIDPQTYICSAVTGAERLK